MPSSMSGTGWTFTPLLNAKAYQKGSSNIDLDWLRPHKMFSLTGPISPCGALGKEGGCGVLFLIHRTLFLLIYTKPSSEPRVPHLSDTILSHGLFLHTCGAKSLSRFHLCDNSTPLLHIPLPLLRVITLYLTLSYSVQAAVMKYHRLSALQNRHLFFHSSGGWKSKVRKPA